ncbi:hypothetical protein PU634_10470 [Oceanimonas pelagia]|uniref:Uncharacterized protein n=1 Tax=Oceanimonas pelagia TaxID=3028314 RepID=A0AA50KKM7_9GAMM|nr:hypothetical protein [Oceanimonas pelagia]WMC09540.1 hypothetical protein PU634_10470 [Oceanimonas pelagia]
MNNKTESKLDALLTRRDALVARMSMIGHFTKGLQDLNLNEGATLTLNGGALDHSPCLLLEDPDTLAAFEGALQVEYINLHQELDKINDKLAAVDKLLEGV